MLIGSRDGLRSLVSLLAFEDDLVRWHAAENLSMLGLVDCLRDSIVETCMLWLDAACLVRRSRRIAGEQREPLKYVDTLISLLCCNTHDTWKRVLAAWMLWALSLDPSLRAAIAHDQAVRALVHLLDTKHSASIHFAASRLLRSLALVDLADCPGLLARYSAAPALMRLLGEPDTTSMVRTALCSTLCNFNLGSDCEVQALLTAYNVLPAVHSLLCTPNCHSQGWAARIVHHLASYPAACSLLLSSPLPCALLDLLTSPDEHCQLTSCSALYQLLETGASVRNVSDGATSTSVQLAQVRL